MTPQTDAGGTPENGVLVRDTMAGNGPSHADLVKAVRKWTVSYPKREL
jgi:hypothetical protein